MTLIACYAPTNDAEDKIKEEFYNDFNATIKGAPLHNIICVIKNRKIIIKMLNKSLVSRKDQWVSDETWDYIEKRKQAKLLLPNCSTRIVCSAT